MDHVLACLTKTCGAKGESDIDSTPCVHKEYFECLNTLRHPESERRGLLRTRTCHTKDALIAIELNGTSCLDVQLTLMNVYISGTNNYGDSFRENSFSLSIVSWFRGQGS